ncbi:CmcJ/NvfI family oxidoreductase [Hyphococcus sp.]|uniref:CmcJ/NvfI family oxidoreductase n=1 Tax=Hyphococcus sp. TaxID=2038636 RepID=UPI0035C6945B
MGNRHPWRSLWRQAVKTQAHGRLDAFPKARADSKLLGMNASVKAEINYAQPMAKRPRFHANDQSRDILNLDPRIVEIVDGRATPPSLDREGFALVSHRSNVSDFRDPQFHDQHKQEIEELIVKLTGADMAVVNSPGVLRFGEKSSESGQLNNSRPARFIHIDINDETAAEFAERSAPEGARVKRAAQYNIWRVLTPPPQDVPLTICDARTLAPEDLIEADAIFDMKGQPDWSFTALMVKPSPRHRWMWFPDMTPEEAIVFITNDSDPTQPHHVPHSAFDNPLCPADAPPRASIEMRAIAYWFE